MADLFADVSLPLPIEGTFTYRVPEAMSDDIMAGARVLVPFRRRAMTGFVVDLSGASTIDHVKSVLELRDRTPLIDARMLELCRWISSYYFCPLGMVLKSALPAGLLRKGKTRVSLLDGAASLRDLNPAMTTIRHHPERKISHYGRLSAEEGRNNAWSNGEGARFPRGYGCGGAGRVSRRGKGQGEET